MSQMDVILQTGLIILSLLEILLAAFILLLDPRNRNNHYLSGHLTLLASISFATSRLAAADNAAQAESWLYLLAGSALAVGPALFTVTLSLLRPDDWSPSGWERRLWRLAHVLVAIPILLTLIDVRFGTRLLYSGPSSGYAGGFISADSYTEGIFALFLIQLNLFVLSSAALLPIIFTLVRDNSATSKVRQRALWLLVAQITAMVFQFSSQMWLDPLLAVALTNLVYAAVYTGLILQGLISGRALGQILADVSLRPKLYIALGAALSGLIVISGITAYASVANQQVVNQTLSRQRRLGELISNIDNELLSVRGAATAFYDAWSQNGFEGPEAVGIEEAKRTYLTPIREKLARVREYSTRIEQLDSEEENLAYLGEIMGNVDVFEENLLLMSDQMALVGYQTTGEMGMVRATMDELQRRLDKTDLELLESTLFQMSQYERSFLQSSEPAAARLVLALNTKLKKQIAATEDTLLAPNDKIRLTFLLNRYDEHFAAAVDLYSKLQDSRANLAKQNDLAIRLLDRLAERHQAEFSATVEKMKDQQFSTTATIIGLAVLTLFLSIAIAYIVTGHIIHPVQELGDTANRLGRGELDVRANVHGRDEIGTTASAFNLMADRLEDLLAGLEQQVSDRTRDLTHRAAYLEASAQVSRAASSILDTDELLRKAVELICHEFDLYYVGLFLKDERGEWAILRAGTGEAGRAMLARGHRIRIGDGMIGWSIANAQARVALEAGEDAMRLRAEELPETRSEAAIPLRSRGQVLGAFTVQDVRPNAFDETAITVLQSMADHVAVALDNARLYTESQEALATVRRAYGKIGRQAWADLMRSRPDLVFRSDELGVHRAQNTERWRPEMVRAFRERKTVQDGAEPEKRHALAVPVRVRDAVIGMIDSFKSSEDGDWKPEEVALMQEIADQLALALDNARLHQDAQLRAAREKVAAEITSRLRETLDVETVLRTAVDEIYGILGMDELEIFLSPQLAKNDNGSFAANAEDGNNITGRSSQSGGSHA